MKTLVTRAPILLTIILVLISSAGIYPQQKRDKTDEYIETQMRRQKIPGLSIAILKDGKLIKARGYGLANIETNTPATENTVYKIASVSKQFIAAGIMLLAQDGKLNLDDSIGKYFADAPETWKAITVRHLLSHTSGLLRDVPDFDPLKVLPDRDAIKTAYASPPQFAPGAKWQYSNVGYYALAEIIATVTGKSWPEFINERVFLPAGMARTRTTTISDIVPDRASGYSLTGKGQQNAEVWLALRPSGAFISTVNDLAKWDAVLNSDTILGPAARGQMWSPVKLNDGSASRYGYGWFVDTTPGHRRVYHDGGLPGFRATLVRCIDDKLTVIMLSNLDSAEIPKMARFVAGFYLPDLAPVPEKAVPDAEPAITAKVKGLIEGFVKRAPDLSLLAPDIASEINDRMTKNLSEELASSGKIESITLVEKTVKDEKNTYRYRLDYKNDSFFFVVTFDKNGKIIGFGTRD